MSFISDSFWKCRHLFAPRPLTLCLSVQMSRAQKEKIAMIMCNLPSQASDVRDAKQARVGLGFSDRRAARRGGSGKRPRGCGGDSISKVSTYRLTEVANRSVPGAPPCNCPIGPHQGLSSWVSAHHLHSYMLSVTQAPCGVDSSLWSWTLCLILISHMCPLHHHALTQILLRVPITCWFYLKSIPGGQDVHSLAYSLQNKSEKNNHH